MNEEQARQRAEELRRQLEYHAKLYYEMDNPQISDYEYDQMLRELEEIEKQYPQLKSPDSLTDKVGGAADNKFAKVVHAVKMESLQNAFSAEEIRDFVERVQQEVPNAEFVVEQKIDGNLTLASRTGIRVVNKILEQEREEKR